MLYLRHRTQPRMPIKYNLTHKTGGGADPLPWPQPEPRARGGVADTLSAFFAGPLVRGLCQQRTEATWVRPASLLLKMQEVLPWRWREGALESAREPRVLWAEPLTCVARSTSGLVHQGHMEGALTGALLVPPALRDGPRALLVCVCQ